MIRRYTADVLKDVTPKLRSCVTLDGSSDNIALCKRRIVAAVTNGGDDDVENDEFILASFGADVSSSITDYICLSQLRGEERMGGQLAKIQKETTGVTQT